MILPHRFFFRVGASVVLVLAGSLAARGNSGLLQDITLPGTGSVVKWTNLSSTNTSLTPTAGAGSVSLAGGFQATLGFYSFTQDYSFTTVTTAAFDISNVVLQYTGGPNPDLALGEHLTFGGGPVLTYTFDGGSGTLGATFSSVLAGPVTLDTSIGEVDYYTFAWQWDLSSIAQSITGISIATSVPIHVNVTDLQINLSDTFGGGAIPEPNAFAVIAGGLTLAAGCLRRRRRAL
jgi:hypothetical protein